MCLSNALFATAILLLLLIETLLWRKLMSTKQDLIDASKSVADASASLQTVAASVEAFVKSNTGAQLVDQATLDSLTTELQGAASSVNNAAAALQALVPPAPPATTQGASTGTGA